ncbi:alpha/beta hydrolase [Pseudonocardia spinosispora]|uniref:alpha/beta hydrolase n=1 Tax=Pseudonocardia spinosispora TaxID=103441 RepID=UPI000422D06D|nr:alpha/beta fold hydrolase [Pseudonocardia spinosispora]
MSRIDVRIPAGPTDELDVWLYLPDGPGPHPTVVMAHGITGVKAAGLEPFAEHFRAHGFAAVVFDYRYWGRSTGSPRELLSIKQELADYRTALAWARRQPQLDAERLFVWGTSFAGMHIVELAADEPGLAGAIAQCPLVDGLAGAVNITPARLVRLAALGLIDLVGSKLGRRPRYLPVSVPPGRFGIIATPDATVGLTRLKPAEDAWPNYVTARSVVDMSLHRPVRRARLARCPLLMVVAETDTMAPTGPATRVAARAPHGELYRSRGGHYDVYAGGLDHDNVLEVELAFLRRHARAATRSTA